MMKNPKKWVSSFKTDTWKYHVIFDGFRLETLGNLLKKVEIFEKSKKKIEKSRNFWKKL